MKCTRCGKENPAEVHSCTPLALKLADELDAYHTRSCHKEAADELRRLHAEVEALKQALHTEEAISFRRQLHEAQAEVDTLREALKEAGLFLHHAWCDVQLNDYSFEYLNKTMEAADAALARTGEKT